MRHVICAVLSITALAPVGHAANKLTLLVQFEKPHSNQSFEAMKVELQRLMKDLEIDWRSFDQMKDGESFDDLVVVKFNGKCEMATIAPYLFDERGPLAFTYSTDGHVLPFSEVECDKIRLSIRSAMTGSDFTHADDLLGRALGRVLAHELHHVLAGTREHEKIGVNRRALTAAQLIGNRID